MWHQFSPELKMLPGLVDLYVEAIQEQLLRTTLLYAMLETV